MATKAQKATTQSESPQQQTLPMQYDVRIRGVKVMESSKGLFVSMPSYRAGNGEYKDICFPVTKEARQEFDNAVLDAYQQALTQSQQVGRTAPDPTVRQAPGPEMAM